MSWILDRIRSEIERGEKSRYALAKMTGIDQSQLSRLMSGERGLSFDNLERLADALGLEITITQKKKTAKKKRR